MGMVFKRPLYFNVALTKVKHCSKYRTGCLATIFAVTVHGRYWFSTSRKSNNATQTPPCQIFSKIITPFVSNVFYCLCFKRPLMASVSLKIVLHFMISKNRIEACVLIGNFPGDCIKVKSYMFKISD